jgi:hypothetical protein
MARKRYKREEIVAKLRQVDVLVSQGRSVAEAVRSIGVTQFTYYRWRREYGGLKTDQVKRLKELERRCHVNRDTSDLAPGVERLEAMEAGGESRSAAGWRDEEVADGGEDRDEALQPARRAEALHLPLAFSQRHVAVLGAIVQSLMGAVLQARRHLPLRHGVGPKLVGHHAPGTQPCFFSSARSRRCAAFALRRR